MFRFPEPPLDNAKPHATAYGLTDEGGLYTEVLPSGSKVWRYKYHRLGKREKVTIGPYPTIGIKAARDRHEALREQLHGGESPGQAKQRDQVECRAAEARAADFRTVAQRWMEETLFYRSTGYRAQIARWLDAYVYPAIGDRLLGDAAPADVLKIIEARAETAVTAERICVIVQQVFNFAIRKLLATSNRLSRSGVPSHAHRSSTTVI